MPLISEIENEQAMLIYSGKAEVCIRGSEYRGTCDVRLEFRPRPGVFIHGYFSNVDEKDAAMAAFNYQDVTDFKVDGVAVKGFRVSVGGPLVENVLNVRWCPEDGQFVGVGNSTTKIKKLVFHLFNFKKFEGGRISCEDKDGCLWRVNHLDISDLDIKIEIKSLRETDENVKKIKNENLCLLTHVGALEKTDRSMFTGEDCLEYIHELSSFFSFVRGMRCNPICAIGLNEAADRVWESWSSPAPPENVLSWFATEHGASLCDFYKSFHEKWNDLSWQEALCEAIHWYLDANIPSRGTHVGIILAQTAIERLSFEFCVNHKRLVTDKGFKDLWASDKFRLLFSSLGLTLDIPNEISDLKSTAENFKWIDAPHALTEIRNSLVHPVRKRYPHSAKVFFEAWKLSLWYLELVILAVCGYSGVYANRLKIQENIYVEQVPWCAQ